MQLLQTQRAKASLKETEGSLIDEPETRSLGNSIISASCDDQLSEINPTQAAETSPGIAQKHNPTAADNLDCDMASAACVQNYT